jgi:hypothetical protein
MNGLRESLRRDDPLAHEPPPGELGIAAMRRRVLDAARASPPRQASRPSVVAVSAVALVCAAIGAVLHLSARQETHTSATRQPVTSGPSEGGRDLRRIYFKTPSGVQVIWQFESE